MDRLRRDNPTLFRALLKEANFNYPLLANEISRLRSENGDGLVDVNKLTQILRGGYGQKAQRTKDGNDPD